MGEGSPSSSHATNVEWIKFQVVTGYKLPQGEALWRHRSSFNYYLIPCKPGSLCLVSPAINAIGILLNLALYILECCLGIAKVRENSTGKGTRCFKGHSSGGCSDSLNICREEMSCITVRRDKEILEFCKYERQDREEWWWWKQET